MAAAMLLISRWAGVLANNTRGHWQFLQELRIPETHPARARAPHFHKCSVRTPVLCASRVRRLQDSQQAQSALEELRTIPRVHIGCYSVYLNAGSAEAEAFCMVRSLSES